MERRLSIIKEMHLRSSPKIMDEAYSGASAVPLFVHAALRLYDAKQ